MRGINNNCLFADVTVAGKCRGETHEHVIQECIGGRYERNDVICHECNEEFGQTIDQSLSDYYCVLIDVLRALMPSRFRKHMRHGRSLDKNMPLILRPGGVVEIGKLHREFNPDGSLKAINAPYDYDEERLRNIAIKEGMTGSPKFVQVPITEADERAIYKYHCKFDEQTHRAAVKTILEVVDIQTKDMGLKHYARMPALKGARNYIRNGIYNQYSGRISCPMYYLNDEFDTIFGTASVDDFSNRVVFCNDSISGYCYGFIQIAHTLPLGLCLGNSVEDKDFSLIYQAKIFGGKKQKQDWISKLVERVLISQSEIHWASFVSRTRESVMFAHSVLRRSIDGQLGRAQVLVNMKCDELIARTLRQYAIDAITRRQIDVASKDSLLRAICEPLLRVQFQLNSISEKNWDDAFNLHTTQSLNLEKLVIDLRTKKSMESQATPIIEYFRQVVQYLVSIDGYPKVLIPLPD